MTKQFKFPVSLFALFISIISFTFLFNTASAINLSPELGNNPDDKDKGYVSEVILEHGIKKRESTKCLTYNYSTEAGNNMYKYFTIRTEISYFDKNGIKIAAAFIEYNFRYNTKFRQAKCLSTFHGQSCTDPKYCLSLFARTKNTSLENGEGFGLIKLEKSGKRIDYKQYIISCDYTGHVSQK